MLDAQPHFLNLMKMAMNMADDDTKRYAMPAKKFKISKLIQKYLQFYLGLILLLYGLLRMEMPLASAMAHGIVQFFVARISYFPVQYLLTKIEREPKYTLFGLDNEVIFGWLSGIFLVTTLIAIYLLSSTMMTKISVFFLLACLDGFFASKYRKTKTK